MTPPANRDPFRMKKYKILHISSAKSWGGGEHHIENLCTELKAYPEVENTVFCVENSPFFKRLTEKEIPCVPIRLSSKLDFSFSIKILKICKKENYDLIHIHDSTSLTLAVIAAHFKKLPPFIFSKKTSFPIQNRKQTLYKYNFPNLKKILCVSEATKAVTEEQVSDKKRLVTIYHGTCLETKSEITPFQLSEKLNIPEETFIIGNIANHIWPKNLETFIKVAHYLINIKKNKNLHFVQIGSFFSLTTKLQKLIGDYDLEKNFSFLGYLPQASNFIPQFDILAVTSQIEGVPQVIYESFYHEVPVVSTNVGGISEVIDHHENGLLSEAFDYKNLSENILLLLKNEELRRKFTRNAKRKLMKNFTTSLMAEKTLSEYKKVINAEY